MGRDLGPTIMTPSPGSSRAVEQGCICPISDNHQGKGTPYIDGPLYWVDILCKLHAGPHSEWEEDDDELH